MDLPDSIFFDLVAAARRYLPQEGLAVLSAAYQFGRQKHHDQMRRSGEPYICHPLSVALQLTELHVDAATLGAAILHDVLEDTETSLEELEFHFGSAVADLVDGMTKLGKMKFRSSEERLAENFRKMILAMTRDIRVILIKLSDRLHNMRTLESLSKEKRRRIAQETLDIYAPLASRLGIYGTKSDLEDLCLKELNREAYYRLKDSVASKREQRSQQLAQVIDEIRSELGRYGFHDVKVSGRPKHFYSIYKKMVSRKLAFEEIHDLYAFRILVPSVKDCYEVLGIIHSLWKPMPGRFKDYVAMPKANRYQSLHTTVVRSNGPPAEIQIRTHEMHQICEYGVAAHWAYKEKGSHPVKGEDNDSFSWLRQIIELQKDVEDPNEFLDALKLDLFDEEIFVFTPKGDVIRLSTEASPVDFAFAVHTDIGLRTLGARVNGKMVPLRRKLVSGDIVEILTSTHKRPSKDWLSFVATSKARNKIRAYLREDRRRHSEELGAEILKNEFARAGFDLDSYLESGKRDTLVKAGRENSFESLLIAIGYGKVSARDVVHRLFRKEYKRATAPGDTAPEPANTPPSSERSSATSAVLVSGLDHVWVTYGKCCNPLPGDSILGFVTRGRGISVHRSNCKKILDLDPMRQIAVQWKPNSSVTATTQPYVTHLSVVTADRHGLLADVSAAMAARGVSILKAQVDVDSDGSGEMNFQLALTSLHQLHELIDQIQALGGVVSVERRSSGHKIRKTRGGSGL